MVNFQVIKVDSLYNMLLERPWLHATSVVASTLHQRLKFPSKDLMVAIMAEEPLSSKRLLFLTLVLTPFQRQLFTVSS